MPRLAGVLLASALVEDALEHLQDPAGRGPAWRAAPPAIRKQVLDTLNREAYALRDEVRQHINDKMSALPVLVLDRECTAFDRVARRMAQADARSYLELERMTLDVALGLGVQGVPAWLELSSEADRLAAREEATVLARNMPAYPFNFEGRAAFNALAVRGLQRADDATTAAWTSEVRRVMSGPAATRFHKSEEARELRGFIMGSINELVRTAYDATSRPALKASFERRLAASLQPLTSATTH